MNDRIGETPVNPAELFAQIKKYGDFLLAGTVFALLAIMVIPLPPMVLDMLLACSITISLLIFLAALSVKKPVDLSIFPILLLTATVFRLSLNVASTRLILLGGDAGDAAAGRIIQTFGHFVVGGNFVVGFVVFTILVIINFVVITKGSGRVAEVAARFTLDAMPGKQMAIDADLNAGLIDEEDARTRRSEITREADFYGAMDGASKFVRGDAIAGIVITCINAIGGILIGVLQQNMTIAEATETYTILTIGDGLVGQIPALIVSTAAGILVTRVSDKEDQELHLQIGKQLLSNPRVLAMLAGSLITFALIPGLRLPFTIFSAVVGWFAWQLSKLPSDTDIVVDDSAGVSTADARPEDLLPIEPLAIEVSVDLLYLVDAQQGGELVQRIQRIRNQFAQDFGVVLPAVFLRDNLQLENGEYLLMLRGEEIGRGQLHPRQHLALDPGTATEAIKGIPTRDPVFDLPAYWIPDSEVLRAQSCGYTVVDVPTVITTHLVELMHEFAFELFDGAQLDWTLERVAAENHKLVDSLTPEPLPRATLLRVFRNLIKEGLSVRDAQTILEAMADYAHKSTDPDVLTEFVRQRLCRHITHRFTDEDGAIHYIELAPETENALLRGLQSREGGAPSLIIEPFLARHLMQMINEMSETYEGPGQAIVLCPPLARGALRRMLERVLPRIAVLSSAELLGTTRLESVGKIGLPTNA
jgi:flagellar biosynthesis protein FlhA